MPQSHRIGRMADEALSNSPEAPVIVVMGEKKADALPPTDEGGRRRTGNVEMYSSARYFTVTGRHLAGTPLAIKDRHAKVAS